MSEKTQRLIEAIKSHSITTTSQLLLELKSGLSQDDYTDLLSKATAGIELEHKSWLLQNFHPDFPKMFYSVCNMSDYRN